MSHPQTSHAAHDPYEILFQPVPIGPVVAPNRFYQVPHCNGMGHRLPASLAAMRGMKAEGGWGVVCTEEVEIHHSTDLYPYAEGRLWDDRDIPPLRLMVEAVHHHGSLAGIELTHSGHHAPNLYAKVPPLSLRSMGTAHYMPVQTRRMDKSDIRALRRWHRDAALRAKEAGFDIIYCYAAHDLPLAMHFMLKRYNDRTDEYGGTLENRIRLFRELIEETKDAVGDSCAVAVRLAVDELMGEDGLTHQGEGHDIVAMLAELPDLWDVNISGWSNDSATSRFDKEGYQESYISFVKSLTSKPVVGVGRYTSPDSMVSAIRRGVMDLVGAARPSIADPFLPNKVKEGRLEDIRECIGCNICVSGDILASPIRCTQNPAMGEEWRRSWHSEYIAVKKSDAEIMVVGAGPAGMECARALGQRGYSVVLVEEKSELGGRVARESLLPGLSEWRRVIDWRQGQLAKLKNVSVYPGSPMDSDAILESGVKNIIVATGAHYRRDGVGRSRHHSLPGHELAHVFTPDDLMAGRLPTGSVLIFDDDHYYIGGVMAELLVDHGCQVTLATPAPLVSQWATATLEQERIQRKLMGKGVALIMQQELASIEVGYATLAHAVSGEQTRRTFDAVLLITDRLPNDALYQMLRPAVEQQLLASLRVIGDAEAPGIIAQAVFSGHLAAREMDEPIVAGTPFRMEYVEI